MTVTGTATADRIEHDPMIAVPMMGAALLRAAWVTNPSASFTMAAEPGAANSLPAANPSPAPPAAPHASGFSLASGFRPAFRFATRYSFPVLVDACAQPRGQQDSGYGKARQSCVRARQLVFELCIPVKQLLADVATARRAPSHE